MNRRAHSWWTFIAALVAFALLSLAQLAAAFDVPRLKGPVNDRAQLLSREERERLTAMLSAFEHRTGHQFALLTVKSLAGLTIEDYSMRVAEAWQLGRAQEDDGLLFLVARRSRKLRIEVGHGLEGVIPDVVAARVIDEIAVPAFRRGDFAGGIEASLAALIAASEHDGELPVIVEKKVPVWVSLLWGLCWFFFLPACVGLLNLILWLHRPRGGVVHVVPTVGKESISSSDRRSGSASNASRSMSSSSSFRDDSDSDSGSDSSRDSYSGGGGSFGGGGASGSW